MVAQLLQRLHFNFTRTEGIFNVTPPPHRFDLAIEEDLIEELARIYGYDNVPAAVPRARLAMLPEPETSRTLSQLRQILVGRDYQEVINYSFVDPAWEHELAGNNMPLALKNPLSSQMAVMRSSLFGSLMANLGFNLNRKQTRVRTIRNWLLFRGTARPGGATGKAWWALLRGRADRTVGGAFARRRFLRRESRYRGAILAQGTRRDLRFSPRFAPGEIRSGSSG